MAIREFMGLNVPAFILPVRLDKESTDIYKAIQSHVIKEVEDMQR